MTQPESKVVTRDEALRSALRTMHHPLDGLRRLHPRTKEPTDQICEECDRPWPCDTSMLLDATAALPSDNVASRRIASQRRRPYTAAIGMDALVRRADGSTINFGDAIYHPENAEEARSYATLSDANEGNEPAIDIEHLINQREWSLKTFGPGDRSIGVVDHIVKELCEIVGTRIVLEMAMNAYDDPKQMTNYVVDPPDSSEFVDVVILALDGLWRGGYEPEEIIKAIKAKQAKNEKRVWPDWREFSDGRAIEHVKISQAES